MKINYFKLMHSIFEKMKEDGVKTSSRAVVGAILYLQNKNYFRPIELGYEKVSDYSGVKQRLLLEIFTELEEQKYITFTRSKSRHNPSILTIDFSRFTDAESGGVSGFTDAESGGVSEKYYIRKDIDNTTNRTTVAHDSKKSKKAVKKTKVSRAKNTPFLSSEIGTPEDFKSYVENSEHPDADPGFYYASMRDWIDRKTGKPPLRQNWKLVFNQFARNDIQRHGNVKQTHSPNNNGSRYNNNNRPNLQEQFSDIDEKLEQFIAIRNSVGESL